MLPLCEMRFLMEIRVSLTLCKATFLAEICVSELLLKMSVTCA